MSYRKIHSSEDEYYIPTQPALTPRQKELIREIMNFSEDAEGEEQVTVPLTAVEEQFEELAALSDAFGNKETVFQKLLDESLHWLIILKYLGTVPPPDYTGPTMFGFKLPVVLQMIDDSELDETNAAFVSFALACDDHESVLLTQLYGLEAHTGIPRFSYNRNKFNPRDALYFALAIEFKIDPMSLGFLPPTPDNLYPHTGAIKIFEKSIRLRSIKVRLPGAGKATEAALYHGIDFTVFRLQVVECGLVRYVSKVEYSGHIKQNAIVQCYYRGEWVPGCQVVQKIAAAPGAKANEDFNYKVRIPGVAGTPTLDGKQVRIPRDNYSNFKWHPYNDRREFQPLQQETKLQILSVFDELKDRIRSLGGDATVGAAQGRRRDEWAGSVKRTSKPRGRGRGRSAVEGTPGSGADGIVGRGRGRGAVEGTPGSGAGGIVSRGRGGTPAREFDPTGQWGDFL